MIIGLTGTMASGKGEITNYLKEKGFEQYVFSDIIREEAKKRSLQPTRSNLQKIGDLLRKEYNNEGIIAKKLLEKIKTKKAVVDGIRNSKEVLELKKSGKFYLIAIISPQKLRYERLKTRKRPGDPDSFEEFKLLDEKENKGLGTQEINKCIKLADFNIDNTSTLENLRKEVDKILAAIS